MEKVFKALEGFFKSMTALFVILLTFGITAEILFGAPTLGMSVISNVVHLVTVFGNAGVVGLISLVALFMLLTTEK